jgi:hypothetical protein
MQEKPGACCPAPCLQKGKSPEWSFLRTSFTGPGESLTCKCRGSLPKAVPSRWTSPHRPPRKALLQCGTALSCQNRTLGSCPRPKGRQLPPLGEGGKGRCCPTWADLCFYLLAHSAASRSTLQTLLHNLHLLEILQKNSTETEPMA